MNRRNILAMLSVSWLPFITKVKAEPYDWTHKSVAKDLTIRCNGCSGVMGYYGMWARKPGNPQDVYSLFCCQNELCKIGMHRNGVVELNNRNEPLMLQPIITIDEPNYTAIHNFDGKGNWRIVEKEL